MSRPFGILLGVVGSFPPPRLAQSCCNNVVVIDRPPLLHPYNTVG